MMKNPTLFALLVVGVVLVSSPPASSQDCFSSSILSPSPFMGNNDEIFRLADGSVWQVKYEYEYMYEYYPSVVICPALGKLIVGSTTLNVQQIAGFTAQQQPIQEQPERSSSWVLFEEDNLMGTITGTVQPGRVFSTSSGNIYEVTGITLQLVLELQPKVLVFRKGETYKLIVDGFDEPLICRRLNTSLSNPTTDSGSGANVIESTIAGDFNGWDGDTIFNLSNGQIWQQSSFSYRYKYAYRPNVLIFKSGSVYKMQVEGMDGVIEVTRLK